MIQKLSFLLIRYYQFLELWREEGFVAALKFSIYTEGEAIPVVKDLSSLSASISCFVDDDNLKLIEITRENPGTDKLQYELRSRQIKLKNNLSKGFKSFAIVDKNRVIADVWYVTTSSTKLDIVHPDLDLYGIKLSDKDVYLFDAYVVPGKRGKEIATKFMGCALRKLKKNGLEKAYGFFMAENFPALWFHRLLGYEELPGLIVKRCLFSQTSSRKK